MIAELLDCDVESALQSLFEPDVLRSLAEDAGVPVDTGSNVEVMLSTLLSRKYRSHINACLGTSLARWNLLTTLLKDPAQRLLQERLGCGPTEVLRALIARIRGADIEVDLSIHRPIAQDGDRFDAIALSKLHAQLKSIEDELLRYACNAAELAAEHLRGFRRAELLYPVLEFYARGNYRHALDSLMHSRQALRQMVSQRQVQIIAEDFRAKDNAQLKAVHGLEPNTVSIQCQNSTKEQPVEILKLRDLNLEHCQHIARHLPNTVGQLDKNATILEERLLNTLMPALSPILSKFHQALQMPMRNEEGADKLGPLLASALEHSSELDSQERANKLRSLLASASGHSSGLEPKVVQCLVLSGVDMRPAEITQFEAVGLRLDLKASLCSVPTDRRIEFPIGPAEIGQKIAEDYRSKGKPLKTITLPSDW
jgi:hypothetical protein